MASDGEIVLSLLRSLPPQDTEKAAYGLSLVARKGFEQVESCIERPLRVLYDVVAGRYFLCSEYNRDDSAFRSPWSNTYFPGVGVEKQVFTKAETGFVREAPTSASNTDSVLGKGPESPRDSATGGSGNDDRTTAVQKYTTSHPREGYVPSGPLRDMEVLFNRALDQYRAAYFREGVSSAYVWNVSHATSGGLAVAFLLYNALPFESGELVWNSIHESLIASIENIATYYVVSTMSVFMRTNGAQLGSAELGCTASQQSDLTVKKPNRHNVAADQIALSHLKVLGPVIESVENSLRSQLEHRFMAKLFDMIHSLRNELSPQSLLGADRTASDTAETNNAATAPMEADLTSLAQDLSNVVAKLNDRDNSHETFVKKT